VLTFDFMNIPLHKCQSLLPVPRGNFKLLYNLLIIKLICKCDDIETVVCLGCFLCPDRRVLDQFLTILVIGHMANVAENRIP